MKSLKNIAAAVKNAAAPAAAKKAANTDTGLGPNEKFPFGIRITNPGGDISWERFKTAKEREARMDQKGAEAADYVAPAAAPKAEAAPAAKKAAAPAAAPKPAAKGDKFHIHINSTGRVCFAKDAAERLLSAFKASDSKYCLVAVDKGIVRLDPSKKQIDGAVNVKFASGRPYVSATKQMKPLGFDGTRPYDIEAKPYGAAGFEFRLVG